MAIITTTAVAVSSGSIMAVGTYTGSGATNQSITGLGFRPRFIVITAQITTGGRDLTAIKSNQDGLYATDWSAMISAGAYETGIIISLDINGFTVGNNGSSTGNTFNTGSTIYTFIAWS